MPDVTVGHLYLYMKLCTVTHSDEPCSPIGFVSKHKTTCRGVHRTPAI